MAPIISGFGFFMQKKTKCSRLSSNCRVGMRIGAFDSSDNEITFLFYSMVIKHTENFLETLKPGNFCVFRDSFFAQKVPNLKQL